MFSFILFLAIFGVNVSASSDGNLIDSDLRNWDKWNEEYIYVSNPANTGGYRFMVSPEMHSSGEFSIYTGALYDLSDLISGNSYSLKFHLLSPSEAGFSDYRVYSAFTTLKGALCIGLASYYPNEENFVLVEDASIVINEDNYLDYFGTDINLNFTLSNIINPCVVIYYVAATGEGISSIQPVFDFRDFKLIDTEQEKEDGFLSKLLDGIVSLFVPDEQFLTNFKDQVSSIFSDSLGFIYDILIFITDFLTKLGELLDNNFNDTFRFTFPGFEFDFLGYHIKLWDDIALSFDFLNTIPGFNILYNLYKMSIHAMCIFILFAYAEKIYKDVLDSK